MQHQLVGPGQRPHFHLGNDLTGRRGQHPVGRGQHRQRAAVHDHVLQLDADGLEQVQRHVTHGMRLPALRFSMRLRNTSMIRR
jgi:hypothetical protein